MRLAIAFFVLFFWSFLGSCAHQSVTVTDSSLVSLDVAATHPGEEKLKSAIASSVEGFSITNVHLVARQEGALYRGMRPMTEQDAKDLVEKIKATDILVFRPTSKEITLEDEVKMFSKFGLSKEHVFNIPFRWKDIPSFKEGCLQTIEALKLFKEILKTKNSVLFTHCTVGEDRTGYIFGMYRMIFEHKGIEDVFQNEMCERGYAEGNPNKPKEVSVLIHKNITPLFLKMNYYVNKRKLTEKVLDAKICDKDPVLFNKAFKKEFDSKIEGFRCQKSSHSL